MTLKVLQVSNNPYVTEYCQEAFRLPEIDFQIHFCKNEDELVVQAQDADVIIIVPLALKVSRRTIEALPKLRYICNVLTGWDGLDLTAATDNGILVTNITDRQEVSDHTMALILACARQIIPLNEACKKGEWTHDRYNSRMAKEIDIKLDRLDQKILGLVGFGAIARNIALKAAGFGMRILAYDPYVSPGVFRMFKVERVEIDDLLKESDYVVTIALLNEETYHMIGQEQLKMMKSNAYIINTGRGPLIDHQALYNALTQGTIAGAALDAFEPEPATPENSPLISLDNVIVTGHRAGPGTTSNINVAKLVTEQIFRVINGQWPFDIINPEVKEKYVQKWGKK